MDLMTRAAIDRARAALEMAGGDMRPKEQARYSLARAVNALLSGSVHKGSFEAEVSDEIAKTQPTRTTNSILIPYWALQRRDLVAQGAASAGGYLTSTQVDYGLLGFLRDRSLIATLPVNRFTSLKSDISFPTETTAPIAYVLGTEATQITPSQGTVGSVAISPKAIGATTKASRQFLKQAPEAADAYVQRTLAESVGAKLDSLAINGTGLNGEPLGLLNTPGIGTVTGTSLDEAKVREFQTDIGVGLGVGCAYATTKTIASLLNGRQRFTGSSTALWEGNLYSGTVGGWPAITGASVPASHLIFGNWSHFVVGEYGQGIELSFNPYESTGFKVGSVEFSAIALFDTAVQRAASFAVATAVT